VGLPFSVMLDNLSGSFRQPDLCLRHYSQTGMSDLPFKIIFFLTNKLNRSIYSPIRDDVIFDLDLKIKNVILRAQISISKNKKTFNLSP